MKSSRIILLNILIIIVVITSVCNYTTSKGSSSSYLSDSKVSVPLSITIQGKTTANTFINQTTSKVNIITNNYMNGNSNSNLTNQGFIALQGKWIYFVNNNDNYRLYKIKTDGTGKKRLCSDKWVSGINVIGGWLYFMNGSDNFKIYKIKTNGTGKVKLGNNEVFSMVVSQNWIYYVNANDKLKIYKMKTDGTKKTKLSQKTNGSIT